MVDEMVEMVIDEMMIKLMKWLKLDRMEVQIES